MLKNLFANNKDIIINTDIDGFLCGMILQKYYNCRVVGFSNSRETIWVIPDIKDIYRPIYIDLFVNRPDVVCIDQHIISFNKAHHLQISNYNTKINPNIERNRTFCGDMEKDYRYKYPFGTVHFLIALMAREGINVTLPDLYKEYSLGHNKTTAGHIILRADDALYSTLGPYRANAMDWWGWLKDSKSDAIDELYKFIESCDTNHAKIYKDNIGAFFKYLLCDGIDGAFHKITDENGIILSKVLKYNSIISEIMGMDLHIPTQYMIHSGIYKISNCNLSTNMSNILNSNRLYSYAFIYGPFAKYPNFSYTIDMG